MYDPLWLVHSLFYLDGRRPLTPLPWPETCQDSFVKGFSLVHDPHHARLILVILSVLPKPYVAHIRTARDLFSGSFLDDNKTNIYNDQK